LQEYLPENLHKSLILGTLHARPTKDVKGESQMKRIALTLLVTLLVFPFTAPAFAQDTGHTCPHGDATIGDLRACFEHAVNMGHVDNQGVARSLLATLDAAQAALDRGQPEVAAALLGALVKEIEAQSGEHIDPQHAAHMIAHTRRVIDTLG
jgi:hypothetical protein